MTTTEYVPAGARFPVSGVLLPLVSTSGVRPSLLKSWNVVPKGKLVFAIVMSKLSDPLPVLVTTLVKVTVEPCGALGTVSPVIETPAPLIQIHLVPVCPQYGRQLVHRFRDLNGALGHRERGIPYDEAAN